MRRVALAVVPLLLVAGCGGGSDSDASATSTASAAPLWNPCNGIDVATVQRVLGTTLQVDRGTEDSPRCALVPATDGDAVIDVNYTVFTEGLDKAWEQMGAPDDGSVTEPDIAGADDARLVADAGSKVLGVTGFLQNGALVQIVNAADTKPFDQASVVAAVREVMSQLSAYAQEGGAPQAAE